MNTDDPRFTAHALGELDDLTPAERAEIEALLACNPAAAVEAEETRALAARLRAELPGEAAPALGAVQRAAVLRAVGEPAPVQKIVHFPRRSKILAAIAASLAVGACAVLLFPLISRHRETAANDFERTMAKLNTSSAPGTAGSSTPMVIARSLAPTSTRASGILKRDDSDPNGRSLVTAPGEIIASDAPAAGSASAYRGVLPAGTAKDGSSLFVISPEDSPPARPAPPVAQTVTANHGIQVESLAENGFLDVRDQPLSTFSLDADTASYSVVRQSLNANQIPPKDAVRIEEMLNYFTYDYPPPQGDAPFSATMEVADCPWAAGHRLVRIGLKGREIARDQGLTSNLTTIARDVKIQVEFNPAQVAAYRLIGNEKRALAEEAFTDDRKDAGGIGAGHTVTALYEVVPAGRELPEFARADALKDQSKLGKAGAGGSKLAPLAEAGKATTPSTAAPVSGPQSRLKFVPQTNRPAAPLLILPIPPPKPDSSGNTAKLELLPPYVPAPLGAPEAAPRDARPELLPPYRAPSAPQADVPSKPVKPYLVEKESGKPPADAPRKIEGTTGAPDEALPEAMHNAMLTLKVRYKAPDGDASKMLEFPLTDRGGTWKKSSVDFRFAAAVAGYGMLLRDSAYLGEATWESVTQWAQEGLGPDPSGYRKEFLGLIEKAKALER